MKTIGGIIVIIFILIIFVLNIIFIVKLWFMTNDTRDIKETNKNIANNLLIITKLIEENLGENEIPKEHYDEQNSPDEEKITVDPDVTKTWGNER